MKRISILAFLIACLLCACTDVEDLIKFDISETSQMTVSSSAPLNLPFEISTPDVETNSSQKFENNNTKAELVKDIKLKSLELQITAPTDKTFNFLKSIEIYISTTDENEILLASLTNIPLDVQSISLTPTSEKLDYYVKSSSYRLRTKAVTRETLTQDIELESHCTFRVTADPL
jgi:hypothetical protein